jgi:CMP/dCMP kinase
MIITLTGVPGGGKSTIAKMLKENLGFPYQTMGSVRRKIAADHGMDLLEYNKKFKDDPTSDYEMDEMQRKMGQEEDNFIMDGRLSWHFIPNSFKVFLDVSLEEAARRIYQASQGGERNEEPEYANEEEVQKAVLDRMNGDNERYKQFYQVDYLDRANYDLVVDTTGKTPEAITQEILEALPKSE